MKSIVTLIDPNLQHDPVLDPPQHLPPLRTDTHLDMVLHHHIAHHNHLVLHLEEDLVTLPSTLSVDHPLNPLEEIISFKKFKQWLTHPFLVLISQDM